MPTVVVRPFSGLRRGLPPTSSSQAILFVPPGQLRSFVPALGTPAHSPVVDTEHGSVAAKVPGATGVNSSSTFGARTAYSCRPRRRTSTTGCHSIPNLYDVTGPAVL